MAKQKFIQSAISRPGALTAAVGGKPSQNMAKVNQLAESGSPQEKREALFYKNVLAKVGAHKRPSKKKQGPADEVATARTLTSGRS